MNQRFRILHLEDDPDYSALVGSWLEADGLEGELVQVATRAEFEAALKGGKFDLILADYLLPECTGLDALAIARAATPETPFLLVSGTIGEQAAIASLKAGATDYVLKAQPERLVPAIRRAAQEAQERRERRRIETELLRREKSLRALTENALDVLTVLNAEGKYLYHSPSVKRVLGYEPEELQGHNAFELMHPDDVVRGRTTLKNAIANPGQPIRFEFRSRHKDGSWRVLEAFGQSHLDDPEIHGIVVTSRDITDRKRADEELRESERQYRLIFDGNPIPMWVFDRETLALLEVNDAAIQHYGYSREEFLRLTLRDLAVTQETPAMIEYFHSLSSESSRARLGYAGVWQHRKKDSTCLDVELKWSPISFKGRPAFLCLANDITERRRLEEQLRQAQKMEAIGQLAGGVAHDFNNILTVIHGHASLLNAAGDLNEPSARSASQIARAAERAAALTRQLLTFSRRQLLQPRLLDLNEVIADISKMLGRILGEDITLELRYHPEPAFVHADSGMIEQVLMNLAVNSRDAMPKGGRLLVEVSVRDVQPELRPPGSEARAGRFVCLSVNDTGYGIPQEILPRIFEPFFTTKEIGKGTGLGLATVYGIVNQHNGWIEVESQVAKGSTFTVFLPNRTQAVPFCDDEPIEEPMRGGSETLLVVEDEAPVRELLCDFLSGLGYQIIQAESGVRALRVWREHKAQVDLVVTDLVMPDHMNGRELAERLWAERPQLKVIFMSGYSAEVVGKDFVRRCGPNYVQKPFPPQRLARVLRECLDAHG